MASPGGGFFAGPRVTRAGAGLESLYVRRTRTHRGVRLDSIVGFERVNSNLETERISKAKEGVEIGGKA